MAGGPIRAWSGYLDRASLWLTWISGAAMITMVVVIMADVIMRYVLGQPMLGSNEIIQATALVLVMAALPYCTSERGHVGVDVFDRAIGRIGRLVGDVLSRALIIFVLGHLVWRAALKMQDALRWGDTTNMLNLPIWPLYAILCVGTALCGLVFAIQILVIISEREEA